MPTVDRALASKAFVADNATTDFRAGRYGEILVSPLFFGQLAAVDEGSYFTAVNATDNTAITSSIATAYSGTASAFIALRNTDSNADGVASAGKRIYPDYIKLITKVVPANAADLRSVIDLDSVLTRFTSGGTAITPANANMGVTTATVAALNAGALTTVALSGGGRTISRMVLRSVIPVTLESYIFVFGDVSKSTSTNDNSVAKPVISSYGVAPAVLSQNAVMCLSLFGTSYAITAATYQLEMGWIER